MFGDILPQVEAELSNVTNVPQVGAEIYTIPWGHIKVIVDKCKGNPEKALFFVDEVIKNNWSSDELKAMWLELSCRNFFIKCLWLK